MNDAYEATLKDRTAALIALHEERLAALLKLHEDQSSEFKQLVTKNEENLKTIEKTYDQKLALQKPVTYWKTKELYIGSPSGSG